MQHRNGSSDKSSKSTTTTMYTHESNAARSSSDGGGGSFFSLRFKFAALLVCIVIFMALHFVQIHQHIDATHAASSERHIQRRVSQRRGHSLSSKIRHIDDDQADRIVALAIGTLLENNVNAQPQKVKDVAKDAAPGRGNEPQQFDRHAEANNHEIAAAKDTDETFAPSLVQANQVENEKELANVIRETDVVTSADASEALNRRLHRRRVSAHLFCSDEWAWSASATWTDIQDLGLLAFASSTRRDDLNHFFNQSIGLAAAATTAGQRDGAVALASNFPGLYLVLQCRQLQRSSSESNLRRGPVGLKMRTRSYSTGKLSYGSPKFRAWLSEDPKLKLSLRDQRSDDWDLLWSSKDPGEEIHDSILPHQSINHCLQPALIQGNKANLWQRYADMQLRYGPEHFNFLPESFDLGSFKSKKDLFLKRMQKLPEWFALQQHASSSSSREAEEEQQEEEEEEEAGHNDTAGDASNGSGISWILKDAVSNRGDGLHMLETEEDVHNMLLTSYNEWLEERASLVEAAMDATQAAKNDNSVAAQARANKAANAVDSIHTPHWLLQTYVPSPHLMNGHRKYSLRLYLIIADVHPLRAFVASEGLALFASTAFSEASDGTDASMHLSNLAVNSKSHGGSASGSTNVGDPEKNAAAGGDDKCSPGQETTDLAWRLSHWRRQMREEIGTKAEAVLWDDITQVLAKTVLLGQAKHEYRYRLPGSCFEILGADIMLQYAPLSEGASDGTVRRLVPQLLEVNVGPVLDIRDGQDCISTAVHKEVVSATLQAFLIHRRKARTVGSFREEDDVTILPSDEDALAALDVAKHLQAVLASDMICNAGHAFVLETNGDVELIENGTEKDHCISSVDLESLLTAHSDQLFLRNGVSVVEGGGADEERTIFFEDVYPDCQKSENESSARFFHHETDVDRLWRAMACEERERASQ